MNSMQHRLIGILILLLGLATSHVALAQESDYEVTSADPALAVEGTSNLDVTIAGSGFDNTINEVVFLLPCPSESEPCDDDTGGIAVNKFKVRGKEKIIANINISDSYLLPDGYEGHDIRVRSTTRGRGGKGTTLFNVVAKGDTQPNDCRFDFEAEFRDAPGDGVQSEGGGSYVAFGGRGMRLDTNGSIKLERRNDTRFVWIDFDPNDEDTCDSGNAQNPAGATGFCSEEKGVDMRIEHQVQEPQGLCSIEPYKDGLLNEDYSMLQTVRINFEGGPVSTPLLEELDLNGKGNSSEPASFHLNYGCQGPRIDPLVSQAHVNDRVLITRMDEHTWIFEGERACLTSTLGNIMVTDGENPIPILLYMPFALCIVDVTADLPANPCDAYFLQ